MECADYIIQIFADDATKSAVSGSKSQMLSKGVISLAAAAGSISAILVFCGVAAFAQTGQTSASSVINEVYLAKDDGSGKAGEQVTEFSTGDIPIHCVVLLEAAGAVTVKMNFVAVAVAGVKPDTKVVSASYTTSEKQDRVNFTGRPEGKWIPGRYRVDLFVEGKPQKQVEFNIKATVALPASMTTFVPASKPKPRTKGQ
jgi:hypothetical protein